MWRDPWVRFAVGFGVLAVVAELVYYGVALESRGFELYLEIVARISGFFLSFLTPNVQVSGQSVSSGLFSIQIGRGCDAYRICTLLSAAIIAFPARWRTKLWGLLLGLIWLNFLNFLRIIGLFFIGGYRYRYFQDAHEVYFPIFLIVMTALAWMVWVRRAARDFHADVASDPR